MDETDGVQSDTCNQAEIQQRFAIPMMKQTECSPTPATFAMMVCISLSRKMKQTECSPTPATEKASAKSNDRPVMKQTECSPTPATARADGMDTVESG